MAANEKQIAGDHYKKYGDLQPWDVILKWKLGYLEGTALKYIARWKDKGGVADIEKAIHFLEKLIEENTKEQNVRPIYPEPSASIEWSARELLRGLPNIAEMAHPALAWPFSESPDNVARPFGVERSS